MRRVGVRLIFVALAVGLAGRAPAQGAFAPLAAARGGRLWLEGLLSESRLGLGEGTARAFGGGGRALWEPVRCGVRTCGSLAARTALGAFVLVAPTYGDGARALHLGLEGDLRLAATPLAGRLDPIVSLGVGALRMERRGIESSVLTTVPVTPLSALPALPARVGSRAWRAQPRQVATLLAVDDVVAVPRATTNLAVTPGVGARIGVLPGLVLRADARAAMSVMDARGARGVHHSAEMLVGVAVAR